MSINKVLVVDDSKTELSNIQTIISTTGCTVLIASNGKEAVEIARREKPDIIFMDINYCSDSFNSLASCIFLSVRALHPLQFMPQNATISSSEDAVCFCFTDLFRAFLPATVETSC